LGLLVAEGNGLNQDINTGLSCILISEVKVIIRKILLESSLTSKNYINSFLKDQIILVHPDNKVIDFSQLKEFILNELIYKKSNVSRENIQTITHNILIDWLRIVDDNNFIISSLFDRVDQSRNLMLVLENFYLKKNEDRLLGYSSFNNIWWSFVPRFLYKEKPIINDDIGIAIGNLLGIVDARQENVSWSMPLIIEAILVDGFYSLFYFSIALSIVTQLFFSFINKSSFSFFLFASAYLYNISNCMLTGFGGVASGLIQSFILCFFINYLVNKLIVKNINY
jgi:hypothetical protein